MNANSDFLILQHGGCLVQNPGSETYCVLVARLIVRASSIIRLLSNLTYYRDTVEPLYE